MKDPVRLLAEHSEASPALRELLRSSRSDVPTAQELDGLRHRLGALLEPPPAGDLPPAGGGTATAAATSTAVLKAAAIATGIAIVGTVAVWLSPSAPTPREFTPPVGVRAVSPSEPLDGERLSPTVRVAPHEPATATPPRPRTRTTPSLAPDRRSAQPRVDRDRGSPEPAPPTRPPDEAHLLGRAHAALRAGRVSEALTATTEHGQWFPAGALAEEREAIAIEALVRLGRHADARTRLTAFARRYPGSTYRWRLDALVVRDRTP
jgi:hypothetical protein